MITNFKKRLAIIIITFSLLVTLITSAVSYRSIEGVLKEEYEEKIQLMEKGVLVSLSTDDEAKSGSIHNYTGAQKPLETYKTDFILPLLFILLLSFVMIYFVFRLLSKPLHLAFHDSLTGLGNRAAFEEHLKKMLKKKDGKPVLMMIDLDNFKLVNDSFGHDEGDSFLIKTGRTIKESAGRDSVAARIGGDEFAVILSAPQYKDVEEIALKMMANMEQLPIANTKTDAVEVTFSLGIAFAESGDDVESLYKKADIALYESKSLGKNQYRIYFDKFSGSVRISEEALKFFQ